MSRPDPWALLEEARDILQDEGRSGGAWDCMDLANRIFTAQEAHEASQWRPSGVDGEYSERLDTVSLTLTVTPIAPSQCRWLVYRYQISGGQIAGVASSMAEAKEAAKKVAQELGEQVSWNGTTSCDAHTPMGHLVVERDYSAGVWRWRAKPNVIAATGAATSKEEAQSAAIAALEAFHARR